MKRKLGLVTFALVVGISSIVSISSHAESKRYSGGKKDVIGNWTSKSIDGDALFFIVSSISGVMDKDGNFTGTVSFTDFQTATQKGTYTVDGKYIYITTTGNKTPYKLRYWFDDESRKIITVKDEKFGVSLQLRKGKPSDDSFF